MTDAPNSVSEFGWRKPHPRRTPPWSTAPNGAWLQGIPCGDSTPIFFAAAKRKRRWSCQKKKRWSLRSYGRGTRPAAQRDAPCRAAGRGSKLFCSVNAAPTRARAGPLSDFRTFCAVLHSEVIGQKSNLTSCSFRAFRFAKRCRGGRGGGPLWGWFLRRFPPIPRGRWRGRFAARRLAWVVD